ncbi:tryptophan/threonine-rich antigen, putative [Plasmodium knowlesi strain H]|uniref:Tryptophan/threonine-rich antigen, putative n=3 Tax=Plasmodium knowlesi TaxID=5850 RepID=A0A5K1UXV1_PLAKH|nr:tryptophan-rich antigen [Plasmodium knowlesi strain H]OTN64750.1 putative Tryptophan/threonine-rich antigen [Plasmodium knowlesi]CAA9988840.1 tryptophan-rich antigen [Plasmodium knowlesi strain H]SBO24663.1 tryptophan/threonine-rich antigen, putative [Plasmodium knowlesi strain H]SBO27949.1 tryptophan/threonine-rich antigen, putative [Plasmodium knowlesi strain H]VVS78314.1 tryptophan-rich antigen [Plasmodium knowlesi strain H]|eukprot:XP_002261187.1 Tryptophan/threonine-rich antigen, putative [Plasmodium knowlesi strain H]
MEAETHTEGSALADNNSENQTLDKAESEHVMQNEGPLETEAVISDEQEQETLSNDGLQDSIPDDDVQIENLESHETLDGKMDTPGAVDEVPINQDSSHNQDLGKEAMDVEMQSDGPMADGEPLGEPENAEGTHEEMADEVADAQEEGTDNVVGNEEVSVETVDEGDVVGEITENDNANGEPEKMDDINAEDTNAEGHNPEIDEDMEATTHADSGEMEPLAADSPDTVNTDTDENMGNTLGSKIISSPTLLNGKFFDNNFLVKLEDNTFIRKLRESYRNLFTLSGFLGFAFTILTVVFFTIACAHFLKQLSMSLQKHQQNIFAKGDPFLTTKEEDFYQNTPEAMERWKENEWNMWKRHLDYSWGEFNQSVENGKRIWLSNKEKDWEDWLRFMEKKWMHYNERMDIEYNSNLFEISEYWNDQQWEKWIRTEGEQLMELDWKKWMYENKFSLDVWASKEWSEWKKEKITSWLFCDWKMNEQKYWEEWESKKWRKFLYLGERRKWIKWKERTNREWEEWKYWVHKKDNVFVNNKRNCWSKWKNERRDMFDDWMKPFIEKWIKRKQWNVWKEERNYAHARYNA